VKPSGEHQHLSVVQLAWTGKTLPVEVQQEGFHTMPENKILKSTDKTHTSVNF
jgi:hypothetical protein